MQFEYFRGNFKKEKIDVVFHAAAFKHVSLIEENTTIFYNNILSILNLLHLSRNTLLKNLYISSEKQ